MVSALDSGSSGPGSRPGGARHFTLTVPLSTQVYKWYRRIWTSIPSRGEQKYSQSLHAASYADFTLLPFHSKQERPPKPDIPWLAEHAWNTCCDLEVRLNFHSGQFHNIKITTNQTITCKALNSNTWKITGTNIKGAGDDLNFKHTPFVFKFGSDLQNRIAMQTS